MEKRKNDIQTYHTNIGASSNSKLFKNNGINKNGITLIALVITILFSYDEKLKCSNSKGFLLATI